MTSEIIIASLLKNKAFAKKVLAHIKEEYFESFESKTLFVAIKNYIIKYRNLPTVNTLKLEISKDDKLSQEVFENLTTNIDELVQLQDDYDLKWLFDNTELWCQERAMHNAILQSVQIIETKANTGQIPELVKEALQVQFDQTIGIEFMDEKGIDDRWEIYQTKIDKISTGIHSLDCVFAGGIERKSLTVLIGGTHAGKTSNMIALGTNFLKGGYNVLYVTLEMSQEKIAQRFDANFLDVDINDIPELAEVEFKKNTNIIREKTKGKLIVKEYPPGCISAINVRALIEELKLKKDFIPDVVIMDYMNLMNSSSKSKDDLMYSYVKAIAEELRAIGVEYDVAVVTGTQGNRETNDEHCSDFDLTNVSESKGTADTSDCAIGIIVPIQLRENNQQIWKILKNRFGGIINHKVLLRTVFARCQLFAEKFDSGIVGDNTSNNDNKFANEENRLARKEVLNTDFNFDDGLWNEFDQIPN